MAGIAVVALGSLGGGVAQHLAENHDVAVFDVDGAKLAALGEVGRITAVTAAEAWSSEFIISLVPTTELLLGAIQAAVAEGALREGTLVVDMSTANPQLTGLVAAELAAHGVRYAAAPVMFGGPDEARGGTLRVVLGTDHPLQDAELALLSSAAEIVLTVDSPAGAQLLKLANNMISLVSSQVLAEAWAVATDRVSADDALAALAAGTCARWVNLDRFALANAPRSDGPAGFGAALAAKDLRVFAAYASAAGLPVPAAAAASTVYAAAVGAGLGATEAGVWPWRALDR